MSTCVSQGYSFLPMLDFSGHMLRTFQGEFDCGGYRVFFLPDLQRGLWQQL